MQKLHNKRSRSKLPFFLFMIGLFCVYGFFSIRGIGDTLIKEGKYVIQKGTTVSTLPQMLHIDIANWKYKTYLKFFAPTIPSLQVGTYEVERATTFSAFLSENLTKPSYADITITILPGWNIYDIDATLTDKGVIQTGDILLAARDNFSTFQKKYAFLATAPSLEGFLYPDTYRIAKTADATVILDRLLKEFDTKIGASYLTASGSAYQSLILASIVEREERDTLQKPIVAGILAKRVAEKIPMGADATVCYGYAKTQKQCTPEFIGSVIHEKSPYNTRAQQGYPPTPIASISLDTWNAVIRKENSPYYYYLHDNEGKIHYGTTLAEHNANKSKYLP